MKTACDTNQTTIASAGGKLRPRSIPAMRNKNPNLLTKIVNKIFSVVFGNRKPSETNEEPQNVPREEGQRASEEIASPVELSKAYIASKPYKVAPIVELAKAYMASRPYKLLAEPPHRKRAFRTSVPASDSALAADIVATSTLPGVSRTPAVVEPPQKKCKRAFRTSVPASDSALAADIVATSTLPGVSRTPAVVEPPQKKCKRAFRTSVPGIKMPS
nr:hypothetical protein [Tanacetum cinerariifolium]